MIVSDKCLDHRCVSILRMGSQTPAADEFAPGLFNDIRNCATDLSKIRDKQNLLK